MNCEKKKNILIIEDDDDINGMICTLLKLNGYNALSAFSGTEGLLVFNDDVDLVLLDIMLPGKSGGELIREIKTRKQVPVIIMSAIHEIDKKVEMFKLGADDYVTKPFHGEELLARIELQLRHASRFAPAERGGKILCHRDITVDTAVHKASCCGEELSLTHHEFDLLVLFVKNPGRIFTKNNLFELVWGDEYIEDENTINVHISRLRSKLKKCSPDEDYIETVWSVGYKMK